MNNISKSTACTAEIERKNYSQISEKKQIKFNCRSGTLRVEVNDVQHFKFLIFNSKQMKAWRTNFTNLAKASSHSHPIT